MIKSFGIAVCLGALALGLGGCNVGMSPAGPSPEVFKKDVEALSPQRQIEYYHNRPMPKDQKAAMIAQIEKKYGIKADEKAPAPGAPVN